MTKPAPFLLDRAQLTLVTVSPAMSYQKLDVVHFTPCPKGATAIATNGHYLAAVRPHLDTPEWKDFPSHTGTEVEGRKGEFAPFSLEIEGLKNVLKMLGRGSKQHPILNYVMVIPPAEGEPFATVLVPPAGDPKVLAVPVRVSDTRFPDYTKIIASAKDWRQGKTGWIDLSSTYLIEICKLAKACEGGSRYSADANRVTMSFISQEKQMMIESGERFVAILMPMRGGREKQAANVIAPEVADEIRRRFAPKPPEETEVVVGGISIPVVEGATVTADGTTV